MNTRLFYVVLAVQALFAVGLIVIGLSARENRRVEYLDLTRRVTSGQASADDLTQLGAHISGGADATTIRALFGPPMQRASELDIGATHPAHRAGTFWIYYPADANGYPVDFDAMQKLTGPVQCYVITFEGSRAEGQMMTVQHPVKSK